MGHADIKTTMVYLHYRPQTGSAQRLASAFVSEPQAVTPLPAA